MLHVRYNRKLVAVFHRRRVAVTFTVVRRPPEVRLDVAWKRSPTAAVADGEVPGLGQLKPHLGRVEGRLIGLRLHRVIRRLVAFPAGVEVVRRPTIINQSINQSFI